MVSLDRESPFGARGSHRPNTECDIPGGDDLNEAGRREASGHKAGEGIERRNRPPCRWGSASGD